MSEINVKDIILKRIDSKSANTFVKKHHYSGKVVPNSQLHFGAFYNDRLHGVLSYGPSLKSKAMLGIVKNSVLKENIELNRMAFDDMLPKNSESRCISVSLKLIKKHCPHIKWVLSFADGTQCGDGTIYRASGFVLTQIKNNDTLRLNPKTNEPMQSMAAFHLGIGKEFRSWEKLNGYQLRYIYFIDKSKQKDLTVPILPYSKIKEMGAGMYKGIKRIEHENNATSFQEVEGGVVPTNSLHFTGNEQVQ